MVSVFECNTPDQLPDIARRLISRFNDCAVVTFSAPMGAGKTTLIKQICTALGVDERDISSPTYSLVNEYVANGKSIFHFDLYRLKNTEEALDFGIEEYLSSGSLCLIEWPDLIASLLPLPHLQIEIAVADEHRTITLRRINFQESGFLSNFGF